MVKPSDIIKATGSDPSKPVSHANPLGRGHILAAGRIFKCAGLPDSEDNLVQHPIITLLEVPLDGKEAGVVPAERSDEAKWELDPAQESIDPANPVCQVCGQPIIS